jgi:hypothetical protein
VEVDPVSDNFLDADLDIGTDLDGLGGPKTEGDGFRLSPAS